MQETRLRLHLALGAARMSTWDATVVDSKTRAPLPLRIPRAAAGRHGALGVIANLPKAQEFIASLRALVKAINEVGHVMGIRTVAEYVEDPETLAAVRALGIDYAQGYAVGQLRQLS
jgi:hypothetical protein